MWDFFKRRARPSDKPRLERRDIGSLPVPSGCVLIADPQYIDDPIRIENLPPGNVAVSLDLIHYPDGACNVAKVMLRCGSPATDAPTAVGELAIDSARVVLVDQAFHQQYWTEIGPDRIGVVSIAQDNRVVRLLKQEFDLDCRPVTVTRAEVVQPIPPALGSQIEARLKSIPEYAGATCIFFHVRTNNTFDRILRMNGEWGLLDLAPEAKGSLLMTGTGYGDGGYPVFVSRQGESVAAIEIPFIDPLAAGIFE